MLFRSRKPIIVNSDLIELIDEAPDTIITLTTGRKILVEETSRLVIERIVAFRSRCQESRLADRAEADRDGRVADHPGRLESEETL